MQPDSQWPCYTGRVLPGLQGSHIEVQHDSRRVDLSVNILLIGAIVLITIGWATTVYWLTRKWLRQKLAWQWWHEQQALQLHHQAEVIRDGLLQQTFAFRRYLESAEQHTLKRADSAQPAAEQTSQWMERFQGFYQSLESLSNELSPPFVADSLPLALQFALKDWARCQQLSQGELQPPVALQFDLPADWPTGSPQKNQTVLSTVTGLLNALIPPDNFFRQLQLTLSRESALCTLTFRLSGSNPQTLQTMPEQPEVQHLKEIFHSLVAGRLEIGYEGTSLAGQLRWRDQ